MQSSSVSDRLFIMSNAQNKILESLGFITTPSSRLAESTLARGMMKMANGLEIVAIAQKGAPDSPCHSWAVRIFSGIDCRSSATVESDNDLPRLVQEVELAAGAMWGPRDDATGNFE